MSQLMQKDDIGVVIDVTVREPPTTSTDSEGVETETPGAVINLSAATNTQLVLGPPEGDAIYKTAGFDPAYLGVDGRLLYTTIVDDIDTAGVWNVQAYWESGSTVRRSTVTTFEVLVNVE